MLAPAYVCAQQPGAAATPGTQAPAPAAPAQPPATATTPPEGQGYAYNAEGRRDPFVSPLRRGSDPRQTIARPAGLGGLGAGDITLKGTMQSRDGYVALVQGIDNKTYIVRPGDTLLDGTVRTITADALIILQQVSDPLSPEKQREVRKVLRRADEVK